MHNINITKYLNNGILKGLLQFKKLKKENPIIENKLLNLKTFNKTHNTNYKKEYGHFLGYNKIFIVQLKYDQEDPYISI